MKNEKNILAVLQDLGIANTYEANVLNSKTGQICSLAEMLFNYKGGQEKFAVNYFIQHRVGGWMSLKIKKGKIHEFKAVAQVNIFSVKDVNDGEYIIVSYYQIEDCSDFKTVVIPKEGFTPSKITSYIKLIPNANNVISKDTGDLLYCLVQAEKNNPQTYKKVYYGDLQGWYHPYGKPLSFITNVVVQEVAQKYLPPSIKMRAAPFFQANNSTLDSAYDYIKCNIEFGIPIVYRLSSLMLYPLSRYGCRNDHVFVFHIDDIEAADMLVSTLKNVNYDDVNVAQLGPDITSLKNHLSMINDGVVVIKDISRIDEFKKIEKGVDLVKGDITATGKDKMIRHNIAVISNHADDYLPDNHCCVCHINDKISSILAHNISIYLRYIDGAFINAIMEDFRSGKSRIMKILFEVRGNLPSDLPQNKNNIYALLITTIRFFNEKINPLFTEELEKQILSCFCKSDKNILAEDMMIKRFSEVFNNKIKEGDFKFVQRSKQTVFDKSTNTIIFDDEMLYVETNIVKELVLKDMKSINNVGSLVSTLKVNGYLTINDKNSNTYRIHTHNSIGEPELVYFYAISQELLTLENKRRLSLIPLDAFLNKEPKDVLPLIQTIDGRIAGKRISSYGKENNHVFVTGGSGMGKSNCMAQLMASQAMLGSKVLCIDVSRTFTKPNMEYYLPPNVVDKLCSFIDVGVNQDKIPVNLLDTTKCATIPDKKKIVNTIISAATSSLDKMTIKDVKSIISDICKNNTLISTDVIRSNLKNSQTGKFVLDIISDALDNIDSIGMSDKNWEQFFAESSGISIISLGNEVGESVHQLFDMLVSSAVLYQMNHSSTPLTLVIDELADLDFSQGSPLRTIISQGRKFNINLIGAAQHYIGSGNRNIEAMKDANIKIFFKPTKSQDTIAAALGYKDSFSAEFNSMKTGDCIVSGDLYNHVDDVNEPIVIRGTMQKFIESPLYKVFTEMYGV